MQTIHAEQTHFQYPNTDKPVQLNSTTITMKIDLGPEANIISQKTFKMLMPTAQLET